MDKRAQGYGLGSLAGYGSGMGYDPVIDNMALIPGVPAEQPRTQGTLGAWTAPLGLAAAGLVGYGLLRGAGRRIGSGLKSLFQRGAQARPERWSWDMEMLGRGSNPIFRSPINPASEVGAHAGELAQRVAKLGSLRDPSFTATIVRRLGAVARED